ncbi:MAG TPA: hypothetical protein VNX21_00675 [Candidatus Thermoplasmatota archaeon]|nr:hypothetical protein [Candidatus Thermoplasmatota archaeon]
MVKPEDPVQAALRRAIERAERARGTLHQVPPRVQFELRRKALHVTTAVVAVPLLLFVPLVPLLVLSGLGIVFITMTWAIERRRLSRRFAGPLHDELAHVLASTRRPHEDYPWSPVLYTVSLMVIALAHAFLGLSWALAFAAYAILGIGDAASALVGVAYGRTRLPWNPRKSVEGTAAGLAAGFLAGSFLGALPYAVAGLPVPPLFHGVVLVGATAGALAETVPRVEDNLVVPLAAAGAMFLLSGAVGLALP